MRPLPASAVSKEYEGCRLRSILGGEGGIGVLGRPEAAATRFKSRRNGHPPQAYGDTPGCHPCRAVRGERFPVQLPELPGTVYLRTSAPGCAVARVHTADRRRFSPTEGLRKPDAGVLQLS